MLLLLFKPPVKCSDLENECCGNAEKPVDDACGLIAEFKIVLFVCRPLVGLKEDGTGDGVDTGGGFILTLLVE